MVTIVNKPKQTLRRNYFHSNSEFIRFMATYPGAKIVRIAEVVIDSNVVTVIYFYLPVGEEYPKGLG